jgi:hypothetical protein
MLSDIFFRLTAYAQQAIRRALGPNASDGPSSGASGVVNVKLNSEVTTPPQELDLLLPKVCEALVLITQCIITITLEDDDDDASILVDQQVDEFKTFFNEARSDRGDGLIECLLGFLVLSMAYLYTYTNSNRSSASTRPFSSSNQLWQASHPSPSRRGCRRDRFFLSEARSCTSPRYSMSRYQGCARSCPVLRWNTCSHEPVRGRRKKSMYVSFSESKFLSSRQRD